MAKAKKVWFRMRSDGKYYDVTRRKAKNSDLSLLCNWVNCNADCAWLKTLCARQVKEFLGIDLQPGESRKYTLSAIPMEKAKVVVKRKVAKKPSKKS